jgi:hypothetical protein
MKIYGFPVCLRLKKDGSMGQMKTLHTGSNEVYADVSLKKGVHSDLPRNYG